MELSDRSLIHRWKLDTLLPRQLLKWSALAVLAAGLAAGYLYWNSMPEKALNNYTEAKRLYESGKYANALYQVNESLRDRGMRLKAYRLRADIYRSMLEPKKAVSDISKVIEMQPDVAANYLFRAESYMEAQDSEHAAEDYSKLLEMQRTPDGFRDRGRAYMKLKQPAKAADDFTQAIGLEPRAQFYLERAFAYGAIDEHAKAMEDLDHAVELSADEPWTAVYSLRARGAEKIKAGDEKGAESDLAKAHEIEVKFKMQPSGPAVQQANVAGVPDAVQAPAPEATPRAKKRPRR